MWETIDTTADTSWIVNAIARGSLRCGTDGSHSPSVAMDICSAAWIFFSIRGEQLGMLAIHLILFAVENFYGQNNLTTEIFCDNKGSVQTFSKQHKRIPGGSTNSDILRVLRRIQSQSKSTLIPDFNFNM